MSVLNDAQLRAVKYYIGDVSGSDPFWGDGKAYLVINSLMYPGIDTETARAAEGKRLNPAVLADTGRLIGLLRELLSCFRGAARELNTFRVERFSDYLLTRELGRTVSFTSTSTAGFLNAYRDRIGIALMRFHIPAGCPCIVMSEMLGEYAKSEEEEVLLPPYLGLKLTELPLTEELMVIKDACGASPQVCCTAEPFVTDVLFREQLPLPEYGAQAGQRVYESLNSGCSPSSEDTELYVLWKEALRSIVLT